MDALLGLLSLAGLSLFLARALKLSPSLTVLLSVAAAMLWFTLLGCFGFLIPAGWLWYALCAAALLYVVMKEKKGLLRFMDTGFLFFLIGGVFFITLFFATQPLFTEWDDFTFWGAAAKASFEGGQMYTVAESNLIARSQPPSLIMLSYMVQFFGGGTFAEYKMMAAYALVYLAAFSAASAVFKEKRSAAACLLGGFLMLPLFFEVGTGAGQQSMAYLTVLGDAPMAALFGGILCFYFAAEDKNQRLLLPLAVLLAALTNMKDMGFALALIALFIVCIDLVFCERDRLRLFALKGWPALLVFAATGVLLIVAAYGGWAWHMRLTLGADRFNLGSGGSNLPMGDLAATALGAFFGLSHHEHYTKVLPLMLRAFVEEPVSLIGPGVVVLGVIVGILALAYLLASTKRQRRRVVVFFLASLLCFVAYYIFHLFLYAFIFKAEEALILKDYLRYISTYWQGWLMASLVVLGLTAMGGKELRLRVQLARGAAALAAVCLCLVVALRGNWQANVLLFSPSNYGQRLSVQDVVKEAEAEGMQEDDVVYLLSQGDPGERAYLVRYEAKATVASQYGGVQLDDDGRPVLVDGEPVLLDNIGTSLVPEKGFVPSYYTYVVPAGPQELAAYLKEQGCTHFLVDQIDDYFLKTFSPLFSDKLAGWSDEKPFATGHRYYAIEWEAGDCRMVPAEGGDGA